MKQYIKMIFEKYFLSKIIFIYIYYVKQIILNIFSHFKKRITFKKSFIKKRKDYFK